jgi:Tannase and feruloyl esterase
LSDPQVDALEKVYTGPTTSDGTHLSLGGPLPGGENDWVIDPNSEVGVGEWIKSDGGPAVPENSATKLFSWIFSPPGGRTWSVAALDFDRDYRRFADGARQSPIYETNPDLRRFKAASGKLLMYVGSKEWANPRRAIDYYETVERTMGGREATRDFARLYVIPGANHCGGGEGAWAVDWLTYLENWVERGEAPDQVIGAHVPGGRAELQYPLNKHVTVDFTRPIYPYPLWAKYIGRGDPNKAENFGAAGP